jgi:hypothetical protein
MPAGRVCEHPVVAEVNADEQAGTARTALIVPVCEAEELVGPYRRLLDHTAAWPVPAHVTVLYPFVPPARITDGLIGAVGSCLATARTFTCMFSRVAWFGEDVVWLAPDPDAPFRTLTEALWRRFPECPPYRGAFPNPTPHLTVGSSHLADLTDMQRAAHDLQAKLPITARINRVRLIMGTEMPGSWRTVAEFALPPG